MRDMLLIGWFTASKNGVDILQWRAALASCGVEVNDEYAPVYYDLTPRKPRGEPVTFDMLPQLGAAVKALRIGRGLDAVPVLVIPNMGHFADSTVWKEAWRRISDVGGTVLCAEPRQEIADLETGLHLLRQKGGRTTTEKKQKARMALGRPTKRMAPNKKAEMIKYFGDRDWTVPAIAKHVGVSEMTVRRRMLEWTGCNEKTEAVMLANEGKWPPKRKLR